MLVFEKVSAWRVLYLSLLCLAPAHCFAGQSEGAGACGSDGFCAIISVQSEVEQNTPKAPGVVIGTIGDDGFKPTPTGNYSARKVCKKEVRVPRVVHDAITRMFDSLLVRGSVQALPASLSPAEQTMLLYYNTIMQQTMNFSCSAG